MKTSCILSKHRIELLWDVSLLCVLLLLPHSHHHVGVCLAIGVCWRQVCSLEYTRGTAIHQLPRATCTRNTGLRPPKPASQVPPAAAPAVKQALAPMQIPTQQATDVFSCQPTYLLTASRQMTGSEKCPSGFLAPPEVTKQGMLPMDKM